MSDSIKEQISQDLQKAKQVGGVKVDRIRQIFQEALTQTLSELREGTHEIRSIANESKSTWVGGRKPEEATRPAPTEIRIDDHSTSDSVVGDYSTPARSADATADATVDPELEAQVDTLIEALINANQTENGVVVETPTTIQAVPVTPGSEHSAYSENSTHSENSAPTDAAQAIADSVKSMFDRILGSIQQGDSQASAQKQLDRMKEQLLLLDERLNDRYGDRYLALKREFRQDMEKAKSWYDDTKTRSAGTGTTWVESKQVEVEAKMNDAGMTIAQKEQKIKQLLRELWHTVTTKS